MENNPHVHTTDNLSTDNFISNKTIEALSQGLLDIYKPNLIKVKEQLKELVEKQELLEDQLHQENLQLSEFKGSPELYHIFDVVKEYQNKLVCIKKDMKSLHEKSIKLKKRAIRLQQFKIKEEYLKEQQKEMNIKQEQDLIAKSSNKEI